MLCFVFVPGNGPNALNLSYVLSGNEPYYIPHQHPNTILDQKLREECGKSLLDSVSENYTSNNFHQAILDVIILEGI